MAVQSSGPRFVVTNHFVAEKGLAGTSTRRCGIEDTIALTALYYNQLSVDTSTVDEGNNGRETHFHRSPMLCRTVVHVSASIRSVVLAFQRLTKPYWLQQVFKGHCVPAVAAY